MLFRVWGIECDSDPLGMTRHIVDRLAQLLFDYQQLFPLFVAQTHGTAPCSTHK